MDENKKQQDFNFLEEKSKLQAEADLLAVKQQLSTAKSELERLKGSESFSLTLTAQKADEVKQLEAVLISMLELKEELF